MKITIMIVSNGPGAKSKMDHLEKLLRPEGFEMTDYFHRDDESVDAYMTAEFPNPECVSPRPEGS